MCLEPITALAILLDSATACSEDWERWLPIIKQAAKANRLVNDCAHVSRELAEGKMTCVTALLNPLEYSAVSSYVVDSQEVQAAIDLVRQRAVTELFRFNELVCNIQSDKSQFTTLDHSIMHNILAYSAYIRQFYDWQMPERIK
jgi:hypothetical protein